MANVYYAQPLLDALSSDFAIAPGAIGAVIAATQAGSVLALLLLVPLGDRLPRRRLLLWQLLALVMALAAVAAAHKPAALLATMLAVGMLGTAMTQGLIAYAAAAADVTERGRVVGAAQGGVVAGLLGARVLAGVVADLAGWRAVYGGAAITMLLLALLLWRALPALPAQKPTLNYWQLLVSMAGLLRREPVLRTRGTLALLAFMVFGIFWSALVLPLSAAPWHYGHASIGAFGLAGLAGALVAAWAGRLADRGHGQRTTLAALLLMLLAWAPLALAFEEGRSEGVMLTLLITGIIMLDLGVQALHVTNQSLILQASGDAPSRLVGCYMLFYAVGSGAGALAATSVYAVAGWPGASMLGALVSAGALLWWYFTRLLSRGAPVAA